MLVSIIFNRCVSGVKHLEPIFVALSIKIPKITISTVGLRLGLHGPHYFSEGVKPFQCR